MDPPANSLAVLSLEEKVSAQNNRFVRMSLRLGSVLLGLTCILIAFASYICYKDYSKDFLDRKGSLKSAEIQPAGGDPHFRKMWLNLESTSGLRVECGLLVPNESGRRIPAIILLGGKATGKHAIDYAIDIDGVVIVAVEYPYEQLPSYTLVEFLGEAPAIRSALLDMVPSVMLISDYLASRSDVDTARIVLLGYSFGAPLVPVIMANEKRLAAAAMVYGGGDLHGLIRHNLRRFEGPVASDLVAFLGSQLLWPVEPLRYAKRISPAPLLMINGTHDEQIPRANAERLHDAAAQPKKIVWIESAHVERGNVGLTRRIVEVLKAEMGLH